MKNGNARKARDQVRFLLAQDIFVRRVEKLTKRAKPAEMGRLLDDEASLAFEAAEAFLIVDDVWKE